MRNRLATLFGLLLFSTAGIFAQSGGNILVDVTYTGSGTVNASHKIYVALWDTADPNSNAPVEIKSLDTKKGTVTFSNVKKIPAYISVAYDPSGAWQAQSPPPSGSSLGVYSQHPPAPSPINPKPGLVAKVSVTFDDKVKVP